jgi:acetyl-CoA synthetase
VKKQQLFFEPNDPSEAALHITYNELHQRVCKMANVLREQGIKKRRSSLYLFTMILLAVSLACARIEPYIQLFFAGFSASAVQVELMTVHVKWLSLRWWLRGNKTIDLKEIVDEALENVLVESISSQKNSL